VRDGEALQRLTEVRTFVIDKTGTLTEGRMKVVKFEGEVKLASCLERLSSHPIAKAISELSEGRCEVRDFTEFPGKGVHGRRRQNPAGPAGGSRRTVRKVKENVAWALAYNSVLIPIASGVLYPFYLPPEWAALAMSMNSVSVVLWSLVQ